MSKRQWIPALSLSVGLFACGGEDAAPVGPAEDNPADPAADAAAGVENAANEVEEVVDEVENTSTAAVAEADSLLEQITGYVKEDKLDMAKSALAKLEGLLDKLPPSYRDKIEKVRAMIEGSGLGDKAKKLTDGLGLGGD